MLRKLLTEDYVQFKDTLASWDIALDFVARPLLEHNKIEQSYVQKIKDNIAKFGSYIILRDGFALPHARPDKDVLEPGMSMLVLQKPVIFDQQEIFVIVMFAAPNAEKHLVALSQLVACIDEDEDFEQIKNAQDAQGILSVIQKANEE